jgi:protein involved in polysaccharide export with SLBB domain
MLYLAMPLPASLSGNRCRRGILTLGVLTLLCMLGSGCASFSNPVGQGIPVRRLPEEYFAKPKIDSRTIDLKYLCQDPPVVHEVDAEDVLGIFIDGITGEKNVPPPVSLPSTNVPVPSFGYPYVITPEGTLPLPRLKPLDVKGKTISQVRDAIIDAYLKNKELLPGKDPGTASVQVLVSLMRPRHIRVEVFRQEVGSAIAIGGLVGQSRKGTAATVELRAYENDVGHALSQTGGLPGLDAINEVFIQRGKPPDPNDPKDKGTLQTVRIPIRLRPGESIAFKPEDIILKKGDIVFVETRDTEVYYVGGITSPRQIPLPRDYDVRVSEALGIAGGPLVNGGQSLNNLSGQVIGTGLGSPSPSQVTVLRRTRDNGQIPITVDLNLALKDRRENIIIQSGDMIIFQETLGESLTRYLSTSVFHYTYNLTRLVTPNTLFTGTAQGP